MKLYDGGRAPNPRRVRVFLAEKGIAVPLEQVDLGALAHKSPAYTAINPLQRVPALELDDGTIITELIAICRYFEAQQPEPPLFGVGAKDVAIVEMWQRRVEFHLLAPVSHVFRNSHPAMKAMEVPQVPAWAEANKPRVLEFLGAARRRIEEAPLHRRRPLQRRRHHRARLGRLHEAGEACGARHARPISSAGTPRSRRGRARKPDDAAHHHRLRRRVRIGWPVQHLLHDRGGRDHPARLRRVLAGGASRRATSTRMPSTA